MTNQCAHGQLRRQCEVCERDEQIASLTARLGRVRELVEQADGIREVGYALDGVYINNFIDDLLREVGES